MSDYQNKCTRCGKDRIKAKTWTEQIKTISGFSEVTRTLYICADENCQSQVEAALDEKKRISDERRERAKEREDARAKARARKSKETAEAKSMAVSS